MRAGCLQVTWLKKTAIASFLCSYQPLSIRWQSPGCLSHGYPYVIIPQKVIIFEGLHRSIVVLSPTYKLVYLMAFFCVTELIIELLDSLK